MQITETRTPAKPVREPKIVTVMLNCLSVEWLAIRKSRPLSQRNPASSRRGRNDTEMRNKGEDPKQTGLAGSPIWSVGISSDLFFQSYFYMAVPALLKLSIKMGSSLWVSRSSLWKLLCMQNFDWINIHLSNVLLLWGCSAVTLMMGTKWLAPFFSLQFGLRGTMLQVWERTELIWVTYLA